MAATVMPIAPLLGPVYPFQDNALLGPVGSTLEFLNFAMSPPSGMGLVIVTFGVSCEADVIDVSCPGSAEVSAFGFAATGPNVTEQQRPLQGTVNPVSAIIANAKIYVTGAMLESGVEGIFGQDLVLVHPNETLTISFRNAQHLSVQISVSGSFAFINTADIPNFIKLRTAWRSCQ